MEWHINDLSLTGQFSTPDKFKEVLEPLLRFRFEEPNLKSRLYCSRLLTSRPVTATANAQQAIMATHDRNFIGLALNWLGKSGPFWDDERQFNNEDYYAYQGIDVTDQGLGETARRRQVEIKANSFSFKGSAYGFVDSLLTIQHGLDEQIFGYIEIENYSELAQLKCAFQSLKTINSWQGVQTEIVNRFDKLIISEQAMQKLSDTPFKTCVADRIFELLLVLNRLVNESDEGGKLSVVGKEIYANYFTGQLARFTDESSSNKINFKHEMTFIDPENPTQNIFCPWHGKIQTPQTRIHIEWPRPLNQRKIKILYIGPKITKH
jgi:hypothetical protein